MVGATFGEPTKAEEKSEAKKDNKLPAEAEEMSLSDDGKYIYLNGEWHSLEEEYGYGEGSGGGSSWLSY